MNVRRLWIQRYRSGSRGRRWAALTVCAIVVLGRLPDPSEISAETQTAERAVAEAP